MVREIILRMVDQAVGLEFTEHISEEGRFRVESKHVTGQSIDNGEAAAPEAVSIRFDQEWFQRVGNLITHVRVR